MSKIYWLWLSFVLGIMSDATPLIERYKTAKNIYNNKDEISKLKLISPIKIKRMHNITLEEIEKIIFLHTSKGFNLVTYEDNEYPQQLKTIFKPPLVLYYKGDINICNNNLLISVVGSRNPTAYGVEAAKIICDGLVKSNVIIVSGLASGLDSEAHKASVKANVPTIAILGTAIDVCYPKNNYALRNLIEKNGVVISEYPINTIGKPQYFVYRNRLIAGLCNGLCVIEAKKQSGTMSTVNFAIDYNKNIFAVPGNIFSELSEGTNQLIKQGVKPVSRAKDILIDFGIDEKNTQVEIKSTTIKNEFTGNKKSVYEALSLTPIDIDTLCKCTKLSLQQVMSQLTLLEMEGLIKQLPGKKFVLYS